jgi:uncharacterized delta-60 repeat protein
VNGEAGKARGAALLFMLAACMLAPGAGTAQAAPGDLDPTFSVNGLVRTRFGDSSQANEVAIQPNARIVVAGQSHGQLAVARYRPDGRLDPAFSGDGRLRMRFGNYSQATGLTIQPNGRILVLVGSTQGLVLARLRSGGALDPSFSGDGLLTDLPDGFGFGAMALDGDGRIVLAGGRSGPGFTAEAAVARFQPNGAADPSFSGDGVATVSFPPSDYAWGDAVAVEADGSPVLGGQVLHDDLLLTDLALARFEPDGDLDSTFSGDGTTTLDIGPVDNTRHIALRPDGRIVATGWNCSSPEDLYGGCGGETAQFNADGSLDDSFAHEGVLTLSLRRGGYVGSVTDALGVTGDGGTVLAGGTSTDRQGYGPVDFAIARLDAQGSLDGSFRGGGIWTTDFLSGDDDSHDVALQPDGRIVAAGESGHRIALARYEVRPGPRDADADGVRDGADRCPTRFGDHTDGCTVYRRSLIMQFDRPHDLYKGELSSREPRCEDQELVRVFRKRAGPDFLVDTIHTTGGGGWEMDARLHPGRYYAIAPPGLHRDFGRCARARGHGFRI